MSLRKKIIANPLASKANKPDTVTRAGITANLKYTRGKQLVEHDPFTLIPDPQNPRPGELVDESWLKEHLRLGTNQSLCKLDSSTNEFIIPEFSELSVPGNDNIEDSYNALRDLAYSIRTEGLIHPIEIFLADKQNDPDYFLNTNLEYGYVVLEGHQRRLAAMMSGVETVTCVEITDESMLAKLKVKHRKLRRQLSENNLRKGLTVAQNYLIAKDFFSEPNSKALTNRELSNIFGLNESISSVLRSICTRQESYPPIFYTKLLANQLTFKELRSLVPKTYQEVEEKLSEKSEGSYVLKDKAVKARGRSGGAVKKYATFKVSNERESLSLQKVLLSRFPEINGEDECSFKSLEIILNRIKEIALEGIA